MTEKEKKKMSYNSFFAIFALDNTVSVTVHGHFWKDSHTHTWGKSAPQCTSAWRGDYEFITVTWEVTKSNILLFHEGLGADQIRKRPVHIKILRHTSKNRPAGFNINININVHYDMHFCLMILRARLGLQDGLHSVCDLLILWVRVSCFDVQMFKGWLEHSQTVVHSFLHLGDQLCLFLLSRFLLEGETWMTLTGQEMDCSQIIFKS